MSTGISKENGEKEMEEIKIIEQIIKEECSVSLAWANKIINALDKNGLSIINDKKQEDK